MTLAVFDVTKAVENGIVIEPVHDYTTGTIRYISSVLHTLRQSHRLYSHPVPFQCSIRPRSEKAISLILAEF